MAKTEIYIFRENGNAEYYAEVPISSRGGMAVWLILEQRYLTSLPTPTWLYPGEYYSRFAYPSWEADSKLKRKEVWDLAKPDSPLTEDERIVLKSTFDYAVCKIKDLPRLIKAYRAFQGNTSLSEQADILINIFDDPKCKDVIAIAFTQTSVIEGWDEIGDPDPESPDDRLPYNLFTGDKHYYLYEEA